MPAIASTATRQRRKVPLPPPPSFLADDALLTAREAAAYRRQGLSTFWRDVRSGAAPKPVRIGEKSPRWRFADLRAALDGAA